MMKSTKILNKIINKKLLGEINSRKILFIIFITSLFLRVSFILIEDYFHIFDIPFNSPDPIYNEIARNIIAGEGFSHNNTYTAYVTPIYPLFLSLIYYIFGYNIIIAQMFQAVISALSVIIIYLISREIFSKRVGIISATISTFYPNLIMFSGYIMTETLYIFLTLSFLYVFIMFFKRTNLKNSIISGFILGIAGLTRPILLGFCSILFFYLIFFKRNYIKLSFIFIITIILTISPWFIRNYLVFDTFIPGSTESWYVFYQGNSPDATGGYGGYLKHFIDYQPLNFTYLCNKNVSEVEANNIYKSIALNFLKDKPLRFFTIMPVKFWNIWRPNYFDASIINHITITIPYILLIILFFYATYTILRRIRDFNNYIIILYLFIIYHVIFHLTFTGMIRFRLPIEPVFIIIASYGIELLLKKTK